MLLLSISAVFSESDSTRELSAFSLAVHTGFDLPVGISDTMFSYGGSGSVFGLYTFPSLPFLTVGASINYGLVQSNAQSFLHNMAGEAIVKAAWKPFPWMELYGFGFGGYSLSLMEIREEIVSQTNPVFGGGAGILFYLSDIFGIGPRVSYKNNPGLYSGFDFSVGTSIRFYKPQEIDPSLFRSKLLIAAEDYIDISDVQFEHIFPVFHKYYDDHPVGTVTITNIHDEDAIEDIRIGFFVNEYMDTDKTCGEGISLQPGESRNVELYALFNDKILEITEATKVAAEIKLGFKTGESRAEYKKVETLRV
jgi:hypothetical protein